MTILSGKFGVVNSYSTVRNWSINDVVSPQRFIGSNTKRGTGRRKGVRSWTGSFSAYGAVPTALPGSSFTFTGYTGPTNGISGAGVTYSGTAFVDSVAVTWNWGSGSILSHVVNFSGHLALTKGSASTTDVTDPDVPVVCGAKITYNEVIETVDTDVEWQNLVQATLTMSTPSIPYVNSSTIASGVCWTGRTGGILDWTLAVTEQNEDRLAILEIGEMLDLKLWADDTDYYRLKWGMVEGYSGLNVDRETGAIISRTVNLGMNGYNGTEGQVTLPGAGSNLWPPT